MRRACINIKSKMNIATRSAVEPEIPKGGGAPVRKKGIVFFRYALLTVIDISM